MTIGCYTVTHNPNLIWLKEAQDSAKGLFDQYALLDDGSEPKVEGANARFLKNKGVSEARNAAINLLHTEWIAMIDDDDLFIPEHVRQLKKLLPNIEADIVSFPVEFFGEEHGMWAVKPDMPSILANNQIPAGSWLRREVWERLKYKTMEAEDWDFWARATKSGFRFAHASLPIYKHRVRQGSLSRNWTGEKHEQIRLNILKSYASHQP